MVKSRETLVPEEASCGTCTSFKHLGLDRKGNSDQNYGRCIVNDLQGHPKNELRQITDACYSWTQRSDPIRLRVKLGSKQ